ncbi:hypothetical protein EDM76_01590 [bacterium]|nr:MAG: hypothetical protein EDM76_01590 [bacterium]
MPGEPISSRQRDGGPGGIGHDRASGGQFLLFQPGTGRLAGHARHVGDDEPGAELVQRRLIGAFEQQQDGVGAQKAEEEGSKVDPGGQRQRDLRWAVREALGTDGGNALTSLVEFAESRRLVATDEGGVVAVTAGPAVDGKLVDGDAWRGKVALHPFGPVPRGEESERLTHDESLASPGLSSLARGSRRW